MASEGGGKMRPKKSQSSNKPYQRNATLFGKLKSSVKDLLIPSWLASSSEVQEEDKSKEATPSYTQNVEISGPRGTIGSEQSGWTHAGLSRDKILQQSGLPSNSCVEKIPEKHLRTVNPSFGFATPNGEVYQELSSPNFVVAPNMSAGFPHKKNHPKIGKPDTSIKFPNSLSHHAAFSIDKGSHSSDKFSNSVIIDDDDDDDDGRKSSPVQPVMVSTGGVKQPHSGLSDGVKQTLWSPEPLRQGRPLIPPARGKPVFNSLLFGTPSKSESPGSNDSFGESLFYAGKTQYGGASAKRKRSLNSSLPYQNSLPLRKHVRVTKLNSSLNATTSATAQRILDTLDRMSGPSWDSSKKARRDSGNDSVLSFTPSSYRRSVLESPRRQGSRSLQLTNQGPSTSQLLKSSHADVANNRDKPVPKPFSATGDESCLSLSQEPIGGIEQHDKSDRLSATHETFSSKSTGKMKAKKFSQHVPREQDVEIKEAPNLRTDFKLPLTNLTPISLTTSHPAPFTSPSALKSTARSSHNFTFSMPMLIESKCHPSFGSDRTSTKKDFTFSTPLQASTAVTSAAGAEEGSKSSLEPAIGASSGISPGASPSFGSTSIRVWKSSVAPKPKAMPPDIGGTSSSFKSYTKWGGNQKNDSSSASNSSPGFGIQVATSLKEGSVMDILGDGKKTKGESTSNNENGPLSALFKKPPGSWDCDTCLIRNNAEVTKCAACETPKPGSSAVETKGENPAKNETVPLSALFKKPPGSWDCDTCLIRNNADVTKCAACETPKPDSSAVAPKLDNTSGNESTPLSALFKKPPGAWDCDTCLIRNNADVMKCAACETPKPSSGAPVAASSPSKTWNASPGQTKADDGNTSAKVSNSWGDMFKKPPGTWECETCLVSNPPSLTKCPACESLKPGTDKPDTSPRKFDNTLSSMFKKAEGSWDCDTCLVVNNCTTLRCIACDSTKPGLQSAGVESSSPSASKPAIQIQPGGGFMLQQTTATSVGSGGFKFGDFGALTTSAGTGTSSTAAPKTVTQDSGPSVTAPTSLQPATGGFQFGSISSGAPSSAPFVFTEPTSKSSVSVTSNSGFTFGSQSGLGQSAKKPFENSMTSSPVKKDSNGPSTIAQLPSFNPSNPSLKSNAMAIPGGFQFGSSSLQSTLSSNQGQSLMSTQSNFTFGGAVPNKSVPPMVSSSQQDKKSPPKASGLFAFGAPVSTSNAGVGLGMGGPVSGPAPVVNGGLGSVFDKHVGEAKATSSSSGFGQGPATGFGTTVTKPTEPSVGFNFKASPAPKLSSGFQFSSAPQSTPQTGFSFGGNADKSGNPANGIGSNPGVISFNATPSFNAPAPSGSDGGTSGIFQFGATSAPAASAPPVFQFGGNSSQPAMAAPAAPPAFGATQAFSIGSGATGQRKMKKAVRRIKKP